MGEEAIAVRSATLWRTSPAPQGAVQPNLAKRVGHILTQIFDVRNTRPVDVGREGINERHAPAAPSCAALADGHCEPAGLMESGGFRRLGRPGRRQLHTWRLHRYGLHRRRGRRHARPRGRHADQRAQRPHRRRRPGQPGQRHDFTGRQLDQRRRHAGPARHRSHRRRRGLRDQFGHQWQHHLRHAQYHQQQRQAGAVRGRQYADGAAVVGSHRHRHALAHRIDDTGHAIGRPPSGRWRHAERLERDRAGHERERPDGRARADQSGAAVSNWFAAPVPPTPANIAPVPTNSPITLLGMALAVAALAARQRFGRKNKPSGRSPQ